MLATLSAPLERPDGPGRYLVGEVFGQKSGSKKRKRSEVSVGIDGDAVNLYDVRHVLRPLMGTIELIAPRFLRPPS